MKQDGQLEYPALLDHCVGEGNKAVQIKITEELCTSPIYKNERATQFENFLTNIQTMLTGLSENGEILNDLQKIRF